MRSDINQLKDQMTEILKTLQTLGKNEVEGGHSIVNQENQVTPTHPLVFGPTHV